MHCLAWGIIYRTPKGKSKFKPIASPDMAEADAQALVPKVITKRLLAQSDGLIRRCGGRLTVSVMADCGYDTRYADVSVSYDCEVCKTDYGAKSLPRDGAELAAWVQAHMDVIP